jgi:hypothetical protein
MRSSSDNRRTSRQHCRKPHTTHTQSPVAAARRSLPFAHASSALKVRPVSRADEHFLTVPKQAQCARLNMQRVKLALLLSEIAAVTLVLAACSAESISERPASAGTNTTAPSGRCEKPASRCVTATMDSVAALSCATPMGPCRSAAVRKRPPSLDKRADHHRLFQSLQSRPRSRPRGRSACNFKAM